MAACGADLLGRTRVVDDQLADQVRSLDQVGGIVPGVQVRAVPAITSAAVTVVAIAVRRPCQSMCYSLPFGTLGSEERLPKAAPLSATLVIRTTAHASVTPAALTYRATSADVPCVA